LLEVEETSAVLEETSATGAKPFVVVGIPAFNEEKMIAQVVLEAQKYADVVVVCDDGSSDMTETIAKRLGADVVRHKQNLGYGASINSLFKRAHELDADVLVTLDADGQHNPNEIPKIVKPIIQGAADLVVGSRFIEPRGTKEMPFYRRIGAQLITKLVNGSSKNGTSDAQSGFRAYNRHTLERLSPLENGMGASVEILLKATKHDLKIHEVASSCKYNNCEVATSTEHPITHGIGVIISIIRFIVEEKPLTLLGIPGILCLLAARARKKRNKNL
jgi:glycosyltransferase involved in cell wall biosynthesis